MRYLRNQTKSDCAPVAIMNALKWLGYHTTYKQDNKWIKKAVKTNKYSYGTFPAYTHKFLMESPNFINVKFKESPSLNDIDKELSKGRGVILRVLRKDEKCKKVFSHLLFVDKSDKNAYRTINFYRHHPTVCYVKKSIMVKHLKTIKIKNIAITKYSHSGMWSFDKGIQI